MQTPNQDNGTPANISRHVIAHFTDRSLSHYGDTQGHERASASSTLRGHRFLGFFVFCFFQGGFGHKFADRHFVCPQVKPIRHSTTTSSPLRHFTTLENVPWVRIASPMIRTNRHAKETQTDKRKVYKKKGIKKK